jgi:hypothetical protein
MTAFKGPSFSLRENQGWGTRKFSMRAQRRGTAVYLEPAWLIGNDA